MKTAVVFFRDVKENFRGDYFVSLLSEFEKAAVEVNVTEMLSVTDDIKFSKDFDFFCDAFDNVIIFNGDLCRFDVKEIIAKRFDLELTENESAAKLLADRYGDAENFATFPENASIIPNANGKYQGFLLEQEEVTVALLPSEKDSLLTMCRNYVIPYIKTEGEETEVKTLKYFGSKTALTSAIEKVKTDHPNLRVSVGETHGDFKVDFTFVNADKNEANAVLRYMVQTLGDNVYAYTSENLSKTLFDLLKLRRVTVSTAESFTAGRIVSAIIENPGASEVVKEGVVSYSNQSKIMRLGVSERDIKTLGAASSEVAYQMAAGLLKTSGCDLAIATTGLAGPDTDESGNPVGLCFIAIGMKDGVHTYKYRLKGTREEITEFCKNAAMFLAVKRIRKL